jgi:hypothetical protein
MNTENKKHPQMPEGLEIYMDEDVKLVLEFILRNVESTKRIKVANTIKELAPLIFQRYIEDNLFNEDKFIPLGLRLPQS